MPVVRTVRKTIRLHRVQHDFRHSRALYRGFVGGRGSGKSWVGAYDLIRRAEAGKTYLIASPTGVMMGDTTFPMFKSIANQMGVLGPDSIKLSPYPTARLTTGATIRFRTAEDPDRMRGPNLSGAWLDEASLMSRDAYDIVIASLRESPTNNWLSATFTPKGLSHWTYEQFGKGKADTALFRCKTAENPFIPSYLAETLRHQYSGLFAQQELDGEFLSVEGAEWPAEFFERVLFDEWPPLLDWRIMALDPSKGTADRSGDYSAWIMLGIDRDLVLWVDCDMDNLRPVEPLTSEPGTSSICGDGIELFKMFRPSAVIVEVNGFQEMVATALLRWARNAGIVLPLYKVCHTTPKLQRIRTLTPYLSQRRLRIRNTKGGNLLLAQMRDFHPKCEHDDGPDALATAIELANKLIYDDGTANIEAVRD